jgi:AbrB family looped-hinge helix DNA binding protein
MENISSETGRIGKRGTMVVPSKLRRLYGLEEGSFIIAEARPDGILIRPASVDATAKNVSPVQELREIGKAAKLGKFDWEEWKSYRDEGRKQADA